MENNNKSIGSIFKNYELDEFFISRMEHRYGLNQVRNSIGRKLKQTGEYITAQPIFEYPFFSKGPVFVMLYMYLLSLMIKDSQGGWKTQKTAFLFQEIQLKFSMKFNLEEIEESYRYFIREGFLIELYDGVKYPGGPKDSDCIVWITAPEAINSFEAMMIEKERKNGKRKENNLNG